MKIHTIVVQLGRIRYMRYIMFTHGRCDQILQFVRKSRA